MVQSYMTYATKSEYDGISKNLGKYMENSEEVYFNKETLQITFGYEEASDTSLRRAKNP